MVHACVFRTCAASTEREEAGWDMRGRKGRRRVGGEEEEEEEEASSPPIQRRTWTWKEAKIDLPAAYLADTRFIRSSCYFPPLPLLSSPLSSTPRDVYLNRAFFHGWGRGGGDRRDGSFLEKGSQDNRVKLHLRVL